MTNTLITICGRGGSKGIPGKNIKPINGKPLIAYSIHTAFELSKVLDNTVIALSTDDADIKSCAEQYGLFTDYVRASDLANDTAGKLDVITDVKNYQEKKLGIEFDFVIDLDITSPLRSVDDVLKALELLNQNEEAVNIFSVNKAVKNPYFNMVEIQDNGFYNLVKQGSFLTRQSAPKVYELNASFYIFKNKYFDSFNKAITPFSLIYCMPHICFDLDEPIDFEFMEYLITNNKIDFDL